VQVRLADDAVSGGFERGDRRRSFGWDVVDEQRRTVGRCEAGRVEQVLDRERDPLAGLELGDEDAVQR